MSDCLCPLKELDEETGKCVLELQSLGLKAKDRIAVRLPPSPRFYALLFASLRIGALFCPLNLRLPNRSIESHLSLISPKIFIDENGLHQKAAPFHDLPPSSLLLFTSGSTGFPKIAVLPLSAMLANAASAISACDLRAGDKWLLSLPLHHVGGLAILFRSLLARASLTLDPSDPTITHLSYVPAQLYRSWPIYPRLRCLLLGGGPIQEVPPQLPIRVTYGMTETGSLLLARKQPPRKNGHLYLGFPVPGKEMKLTEEGEILVRGDSLFAGYFDGQIFSRQEDWFATKDLALFDPEEGFAIVGRKDNQFISGGENIQPEEIERELSQFPGMIEAIVVPIKDHRFGFRPAAAYRTVNGKLDEAKVQRFLAERLPKYKIPNVFLPLAEFGEKIPRKQIFDLLNENVLK